MNAVIYVRVSTAEQVDNYSLDSQEKACRAYCAREGFTVARVFREEGASAKTIARPQLEEALQYCAENAEYLDFLVVYRVDRLARQVLDHQTIRMTLLRYDIKLRAVQETFDSSASGKFMENVVAAMAQFDNDLRAARTIEGMKEGLSRGRWQWVAPIGYARPLTEKKRSPSLVPDPETAPLIVRAFELAASGTETRRSILDKVTTLGLRRRGKPLSLQAVGTMLRNPIYKGRVVSDSFGIDAEGDFEPLVSADLFHAAQAALDRRGRPKEQRRWDHPDFPLRRFARCGLCNSPLTGSWSRGRRDRYAYYRCHRKGCGGVSVRKEKLEEQFLDLLRSLEAKRGVFDLMAEIVRDAGREREREANQRNRELKRRKADLELQRERLDSAFLYESRIDAATYERESTRIGATIIEVDSLAQDVSPSSTVDTAIAFASDLLGDLSGTWNRLPWQLRPGFLRVVFPDGIVVKQATIGTADIACLFYGNSLPDDVEEAVVAPTRFELALPA